MRRRRSRRRRRGGSGRARAAPLARRGCRRRRARVSQRRSHAPLSRTRRRRARRVRAPWCVSPRRGAAVRDAIKKCLVIRQTSKPLANSQKGFWRHHFHGTIPLTSHGIPVMIRFHFFNTLRLARGSHHRCHLERTCALSTAASPRSSRGADPGSASRRTLEAHTRGRPRLASGRSRARVGHRELGTRASNGLVRAHGARRSTRSAPPFALRRARERRLSPWPSTRTRFGSWRTAA